MWICIIYWGVSVCLVLRFCGHWRTGMKTFIFLILKKKDQINYNFHEAESPFCHAYLYNRGARVYPLNTSRVSSDSHTFDTLLGRAQPTNRTRLVFAFRTSSKLKFIESPTKAYEFLTSLRIKFRVCLRSNGNLYLFCRRLWVPTLSYSKLDNKIRCGPNERTSLHI